MIPLNLTKTCDGCGKKFTMNHTLLCPKGELVLVWCDEAAKEWGDIKAWDLTISEISYKP